ncbi:hypothetical protein BMS3Abin17_00111 [archaeon BMS3Abin17]|nr:hypothetical protein BMS3Abin17_00111 [archaeon BMS3Abin17]HDZ60147.1 hypothetical protein [Candidatus Pacearchaeota archaeon]
MMNNLPTWRVWVILLLLAFSMCDLLLTFYYVHQYKKWQSDKPYNLIENNPLLVFLWNTFGLKLGMFIGSVMILSLMYIIGRSAHPIVVGIVFLVLCYALFNHHQNINLLVKLMQQYPDGHLPVKTFGNVVGNNIK